MMHPLYFVLLVLSQLWLIVVGVSYLESKKRLKQTIQWQPPDLQEFTNVGVCSIQGRRPYMEDTYCVGGVEQNAEERKSRRPSSFVYGVFDGHGGAKASAFSAQTVLQRLRAMAGGWTSKDVVGDVLSAAFKGTDADWLALADEHEWDDGTTAVVGVVYPTPEGRFPYALCVGNAGDSRAVVARAECDGDGQWYMDVVEMSRDHKPSLPREKSRIEELGGSVRFDGATWRVQGCLAVSRAIGDRRLKTFVIPDPDLDSIPISPRECFLIIASDGIWDVMTNDTAVKTVEREIMQKRRTVTEAAETITNTAYHMGTTDNATCVIVDLRPFHKSNPFAQHGDSAD